VKGICARGGFELDLQWQHGVLQRVMLLSRSGGPCILRYRDRTLTLNTVAGKEYRIDGELKLIP
jgi:alpha-L-fucosidase 2